MAAGDRKSSTRRYISSIPKISCSLAFVFVLACVPLCASPLEVEFAWCHPNAWSDLQMLVNKEASTDMELAK